MPENVKPLAPIRVAHVITGLHTGGAEAMLNKLAQTEKTAVSAVVIALTQGGKYRRIIEQNGIPVHVLDFKKWWQLPWLLFCLYRLIRQHNTQIVQAWMYHAVFVTSLTLLFCRFTGFKPRFLWNIRHSLMDINHESRVVQWLIKWLSFLVFLPDKVIFNSMNSAREHQRFWSIASKIQFLPNGFELDVWRTTQNSEATPLRDLLQIKDGFIFGNVARAHPMKNQEGLIHLFKQLRVTFPNIHLVLFGKGTECLPGVAQSDGIYALGERSDMPVLLPALDCFVLSSNWGEGFPNVLGEAMACEIPCITTNVGDSAMLLNHADWVVDPFDEEALLQTLHNMLTLSATDRAILGKAHRSRVQAQFEIGQVTHQYLALYRNLLN